MYKEFIKEKEFDGTLGNLIREIIEAFANEGIVKSKLGEFCNIAGAVTLEEYGDFDFNITVDTGVDGELDMGVLEEEVITEAVINHFLLLIEHKNRELNADAQIEAIRIRLGSNIKATYTLAYS